MLSVTLIVCGRTGWGEVRAIATALGFEFLVDERGGAAQAAAPPSHAPYARTPSDAEESLLAYTVYNGALSVAVKREL